MTDKADSESLAALLSREIESIRSHREWARQQAEGSAAAIDAAWQIVLKTAAELRNELRGHERLRYFNIARDRSEISVAFNAGGGQPSIMSLSRRHPDGKYPGSEYIWCRELGRDDRRYQEAEEVIKLLVKHCALNLI